MKKINFTCKEKLPVLLKLKPGDELQTIRKAFEESKKGRLCIMLLPVSTSTIIFHEIIYPNAEIRFIKKRIKFKGVNSQGRYVEDKCGMHDSMLVIFRPHKIYQEKDTSEVKINGIYSVLF